MPRKTTPALALYRGGIETLTEIAIALDGASFVRYQERGSVVGFVPHS